MGIRMGDTRKRSKLAKSELRKMDNKNCSETKNNEDKKLETNEKNEKYDITEKAEIGKNLDDIDIGESEQTAQYYENVDIEDDDIIEYDDYLEAESRYDIDELRDQKSFHVVFDDYDSLYEYSLESEYSDSALNRRQSLCSSNDYADVTSEDKNDSY